MTQVLETKVDTGLRAPNKKAPLPAVPFGNRITVLDGVRGVAVLMVLAFHATGFGGLESTFGKALHLATGILWCGVDLFFVLSGFLITGILIDSRAG